MNDPKVRVFLSWVFLLLIWPIGLFMITSYSLSKTPFILSVSGPFFATILRTKYSRIDRKAKQYALGFMLIVSLVLHLINEYSLFVEHRYWIFLFSLACIFGLLVWYVYDDIKLLIHKEIGTLNKHIFVSEEAERKFFLIVILLIVIAIAAVYALFL